MQTKNPLFDDIAKAMESAMSMAASAGEEAKAAVRAQADRMATELDLVRRDEFEAFKTLMLGEIAKLRAELAQTHSSTTDARPADDAG
jgi:BMFP domain-containing protein YqiC